MTDSDQHNFDQSLTNQHSLQAAASQAKAQALFSHPGVVLLIVGMVGLFLMVQLLGIYLFAPIVFSDHTLTTAQRFGMGSFNGTVTSYALLFTLVVIGVVTYAIVRWRISRVNKAIRPISQQGKRQVGHYLAMRPFNYKVGLGVLGIWLLFVIATESLSFALDKDPTAFVDTLYFSANPKWLLIVVMVLVAPVYEELMFRGILWSALREQIAGRKGVWLATIVTSIIFAIIHVQYAIYEMSVIFILALLLSYARVKSGSLWLPIIIHILNNAAAMWLYISVH